MTHYHFNQKCEHEIISSYGLKHEVNDGGGGEYRGRCDDEAIPTAIMQVNYFRCQSATTHIL